MELKSEHTRTRLLSLYGGVRNLDVLRLHYLPSTKFGEKDTIKQCRRHVISRKFTRKNVKYFITKKFKLLNWSSIIYIMFMFWWKEYCFACHLRKEFYILTLFYQSYNRFHVKIQRVLYKWIHLFILKKHPPPLSLITNMWDQTVMSVVLNKDVDIKFVYRWSE